MTVVTLCSIEDDGTTIDYSFQPGTWFDSLNHYVKFLRAQGYLVPDDAITVETEYAPQNAWELNNIKIVEKGAV